MFKNVATKIAVFAFDTATGVGMTGDAANITAYVSKDYGSVTALADTSAAEMDATNAPGWYVFDLAQAETNADALVITGKSSTSGVSVVGQQIFTTPNRFSSLVIGASGVADANTVELAGETVIAGAAVTFPGEVAAADDLAQVQLVTDRLATTLEPASGSPGEFRFSADALVNTPAGSGGGGDCPSAAEIAAAVWDEPISGHLDSGSTGAALNAAGSSGDPWATPLPGAYGAGTAGHIIGTNLDAEVSTRASQSTADDILTDTGTTLPGTLATIAGYLDTEIAAIKAKTDNLPASPAAVGDIPTAVQNADALLNRDMSAVSDTNARSPLNALRFIRNRWVITGGTLSVKKEDDSTEAWNAAVSTTPGADPVTGNDPS